MKKSKSIIQKPAFRIAFCSVTAAVEVVLLFIAGFSGVGTYALPCFAGLITIAVVIEYKCKWALGVYAVAALLSFLLSGNKEAALMFTAFFGYYPILKNVLDRHINNIIVRWIVKFAVFNAAAVGSFYAAIYLLSIPASEFSLFGVYLPLVFLLAGNVFFLIYDIAVNVFVKFYVQKLRSAVFGRYI